MRTESERWRALKLRIRGLLGDTLCIHNVGAMYATGDGLPKRPDKAVRWYERGVRRGDAESMWDLGHMLLIGEGIPAAPQEGLSLIRRAATSGDPAAPGFLAWLYKEGAHGVEVNLDESRHWETIEKASDDGA
jgi:TPR repeat protein